MYKVLLTDNLAEKSLEVFDRYSEIEVVRTGTLSGEELMEILPEYHAIIVRSPTYLSREILARGKKLKFIGRAGAGCDNIDLEEATKRGIVVMNVSFANTVSTAEHTWALILSLTRQVPQAHQSVTSGDWNRSAFRGVELHGKTLGIIGLGRVGKEVAKRALAFSMRVIAADPQVDKKAVEYTGIELVDLEDLLKSSHIVTIHVPLNSSTRDLISEKEIELMRDGAYLINCARGGVIEESAVVKACRSGKLAGVACDVYRQEPPGGSSLLSLKKSVFTPHIGGSTKEAQVRVAVDISNKIANALVKGIIQGAVNRPDTMGIPGNKTSEPSLDDL